MSDDTPDGSDETIGQGLAARLVEARTHASLSQAELAGLAGISAQQIYRLEGGGGDGARLGTVAALARELGVSPAWLAFGEHCTAPRWVKLRTKGRPRKVPPTE